jgi:hypothetical protein
MTVQTLFGTPPIKAPYGPTPVQPMVRGRKRARVGKASKRPRRMKSAHMKGSTPFYMFTSPISRTILFIIKHIMPMGGDINPISTFMTTNTPNQMGSNPNFRITG